jgi:NhaP-type Na+/H+ or K+/H+ antiporter
MQTILIAVASLIAAYLASRLMRHGPFMLADLAGAVIGALAGLSVAQFLTGASAVDRLALPLLFACGLTIGIASLRQRSFPYY